MKDELIIVGLYVIKENREVDAPKLDLFIMRALDVLIVVLCVQLLVEPKMLHLCAKIFHKTFELFCLHKAELLNYVYH